MTEKKEANRLYRLMYVIIRDKQDAKDCAIIMAKEISKIEEGHYGDGSPEEYWEEVINEVKKI